MTGFDIFTEALQSGDLAEIPVGIDEFLNGEDYLDRPEVKLSPDQRMSILASTQIYKKKTLYEFLSAPDAAKRWEQTCDEIVLQVGKGGGKDFISSVSCLYVVYLLLCLKDPSRYYGKPSGDSIDLINIAVNADQANRVFFGNVVRLLKKSPWFRGKYANGPDGMPARAGEVSFQKEITLYSGHSEREAWEGYNVIFIVLDEIAGFAEQNNKSTSQTKTGMDIYKMCKASVRSRFGDFGKLVLLSFPRRKGDIIQERYEALIATKEVQHITHTFYKDPELGDTPGNTFNITYDMEYPTAYHMAKKFALKRPSWEFNPTQHIDDYAADFYTDPVDALGRVACMPSASQAGLFKDEEKLERAFSRPNGVSHEGVFSPHFLPLTGVKYYVHVDLAVKHDRCAVAIAHVDSWRRTEFMQVQSLPAPVVVVDALRFWTPTSERNIDLVEVRDYVVSLAQRGFNIGLVTFDRWNSDEMVKYLNTINIQSKVLSVAKPHYLDLVLTVAEERLIGPDEAILRSELMALRLTEKDKVDHPSTNGKDLSDAVCGAVYNAIYNTSRNENQEIDIVSLKDLQRTEIERARPENVIHAPRVMPQDLADYLAELGVV